MIKRKHSRKSRGQTALEYALVIGVIVLGVIFAGKTIFGEKGSLAEQLMEKSVTQATKAVTCPNGDC